MRLIAESGTRVLQGRAHWLRCAVQDLVAAGDTVMLATTPPTSPAGGTTP